MKFKATEEQIKQIAVNAVKASSAMGMGHFHFNGEQEFKPDDFKTDKSGLYLDYVQGRMVKLNISRAGEGEWEIHGEPRSDYQSWKSTYPTNDDLVNSVIPS